MILPMIRFRKARNQYCNLQLAMWFRSANGGQNACKLALKLDSKLNSQLDAQATVWKGCQITGGVLLEVVRSAVNHLWCSQNGGSILL